jgi:Fic family protein
LPFAEKKLSFSMMIHYKTPARWIHYNPLEVLTLLAEAKAAVLALKSLPFLKSWGEALQKMQLKREVAGTSRIEGADLTERELDLALSESPEDLLTRSQKQAAAAAATYRWIEKLPADRPLNGELICEIHRRIVTGADDDHCPPGVIRGREHNVTFGSPRHRGVEGGKECEDAFASFTEAIQKGFSVHDPLIQALALHYHFAAMHPFLDGNGRTARALEALMLQRVGLRDPLCIAMSNYYYEEKLAYLACLAAVRANEYDLTPFLSFGLRGIALQCRRLVDEIKTHLSKALFRNQANYLFHRLRSDKKRVIAERQMVILNLLLDAGEVSLDDLIQNTASHYQTLGNPRKTIIRDLNYLIALKAITFTRPQDKRYIFTARLKWPEEITETEFFQKVKSMPKAKTHGFLS